MSENKPEPMVFAIVRPTQPIKKRVGRGFSLNELKEAGLTEQQARKLGLKVDRLRRTVHPENVEALKKFIQQLRTSS
ncbi:MAG: 50S ribosomal protein L13e [Candidatus Methanomethylicota archaeon]|uniref:50S ribosomal protein L13e n=1 Tax=Thermoproteota archaeon TaxID=2056631 RepID=A0A497EQS1_9CREN|nr:MAG: 50S ribosomal protein L13e [Candidatus Verstraetearchaeota archaeon]